jgi:regulator of replication initiation timing
LDASIAVGRAGDDLAALRRKLKDVRSENEFLRWAWPGEVRALNGEVSELREAVRVLKAKLAQSVEREEVQALCVEVEQLKELVQRARVVEANCEALTAENVRLRQILGSSH